MTITYAYSISSDFQNETVNSALLSQEIRASAIATDLSHINTDDDDCTIHFADELSPTDEGLLDELVAAHGGGPLVTGNKNYSVRTYSGNKLITDTWYTIDSGGGVYSGKVEETTYEYSGNKVTSRTVQEYWSNGRTKGDPVIWLYFTDGENKIEKRQS